MGLYTSLIRPLLFQLPPERAQALAELALRQKPVWRLLSNWLNCRDPRLSLDAAGLSMPNPVGLAAGMDKDCRSLTSLASMGFGYLVGGTVTPEPRPGNPRPRLVRYARDRSLVNAMGFPGRGLEKAERRLKRLHLLVPVVISVAALDVEGFSICHRRLEPLVDAVELNISSPNTTGIRVFQEPSMLSQLLTAITSFREKPLFVKLPPYFDNEGRDRVLSLARICIEHGVEGLTAINTRPIAEPQLEMGQGGLSGKPIFHDMLRIVRDLRSELGPQPLINACGGIYTGEDALAAMEAGANTVQLFTSLVYQGPGVVGNINRDLLSLLELRGLPSVREIERLTEGRRDL